jgi:class 3 adenylate cyclase
LSSPTEVTQRRKLATVLFCDVSGSTALGERVDAEAVRELMFRYFHEMRSAIERHGGTVEKFIGDAVVAVFGVPTAHEDDALRAVRAAAEMQERASSLNKDLEKRFGIRIALRIGLNTGEVVAGDTATRETFVTGDAVNIAARLEQHAEPGEVLLGSSTYKLVREVVTADAGDPITVKGKTAPLKVHRLIEVRVPQGSPARRAGELLVGREKELAELERALEDAVSARACRLVTVLGEPGVGKSRLAAELIAGAGTGVTVLQGRCLSYGEGITYWPVIEMIRGAAKIRDEHSASEARARLSEILPDEPVAAVHLARLLGLAEGASSPPEITWAVRKLLEALAASSALLALVDDIQWAESALLDLLYDLSTIARGPILLLCLARPELLELRRDWDPTLRLEALEAADSDRLLAETLTGGLVPEDVRIRVAAAARGNPLFIEELAAMLVDEGLLARTNGSWEATRELAEIAVPTTVSALLGARLDRLENSARQVLERGAIEGEVFHRGAVRALSPVRERKGIAPMLRMLEEREFVRPDQAAFTDDAAFRFRHILLRDAAYHGIAKRVRADLHAGFADWLEIAAGERVSEYEEISGYHLEQSYRLRTELGPADEDARDTAARAYERLASAGHRAFARGDFRAASNLLGRAIELTSTPETDVVVDLIETRLGFGDFDGAQDVADLLAERNGDAEATYAALYTSVVGMQRDPEGANTRAAAQADAAIETFGALGNERGLAKAWALRAAIHMARGDLARTREAGEMSLLHASRAGDSRQEAEGVKMIGAAISYGAGSLSESARVFEEQIDWARGHADLATEAALLVAIAVLRAARGEFAAARETAARGEALLAELGSLVHLAAFNASGQIAFLAGDYPEAERRYRWAYETLEAVGEKGFLSSVAFQVARALLEQGRLEEAWELVDESRALGASDDVVTQFGWRAVGARVLARQERFAEAERLARDAVGVIEATDYLENLAEALFDLGAVLAQAGRPTEAAEVFARALSLWERKENIVMAERARAQLAELQPAGSSSQ